MDRNIKAEVSYNIKETSLSARRAWIEIQMGLFPAPGIMVALRKESVDRNCISVNMLFTPTKVALRKESVDRNEKSHLSSLPFYVALRKESVDRNADQR